MLAAYTEAVVEMFIVDFAFVGKKGFKPTSNNELC